MNTTKLLMGAAALCMSATAMLAAAGPAHARDVTVRAAAPEDVPQVIVSVADLRLTSASGKKRLHRRVASAVSTVCAPHYEGARSLGYNRCLGTAWDGARPQMARAISAAERHAQAGGMNVAAAAISVTAGPAQ